MHATGPTSADRSRLRAVREPGHDPGRRLLSVYVGIGAELRHGRLSGGVQRHPRQGDGTRQPAQHRQNTLTRLENGPGAQSQEWSQPGVGSLDQWRGGQVAVDSLVLDGDSHLQGGVASLPVVGSSQRIRRLRRPTGVKCAGVAGLGGIGRSGHRTPTGEMRELLVRVYDRSGAGLAVADSYTQRRGDLIPEVAEMII